MAGHPVSHPVMAVAAGLCLGVALDALAYWLWVSGIGPQFEDRLYRWE